jgi:GAF domain-containing protein
MPPFESRDQVVADLELQSVMEGLQVQVVDDACLLLGTHCAESVQKALAYLGQVTECSAAGLLLARGPQAQLFFYRARSVDDFFLSLMQQRLLSSYRVYAGAAVAQSEPDVVVYGQATLSPLAGQVPLAGQAPLTGQAPLAGQTVAGPYEPLRSLLVVPVLDRGHVAGMVSVASVFLEAFDGEDLCSLSALAAQLPLLLDPAADGASDPDARVCLTESERSAQERGLRARVQNHATSICGLARSWQMQDESALPEVLRKDLDAIAESALQIRDLVT